MLLQPSPWLQLIDMVTVQSVVTVCWCCYIPVCGYNLLVLLQTSGWLQLIGMVTAQSVVTIIPLPVQTGTNHRLSLVPGRQRQRRPFVFELQFPPVNSPSKQRYHNKRYGNLQ